MVSSHEYKAVMQYTTKSRAGERKIPLMKPFKEYLLENRREYIGRDEYIFQSRNKTFISTGNSFNHICGKIYMISA